MKVVFNLAPGNKKSRSHKLSVSFQKIQNTATCINYIIVLMKYFIFNMKYRSVFPTFDIFKKMLKLKLDIEKEIAFMNDKIDTHRLKWTDFINY